MTNFQAPGKLVLEVTSSLQHFNNKDEAVQK